MTNPRWIIKRWVKRLRQRYLLWRDGDHCAYCDCVLIRWKAPPVGEGWTTTGPKGRQLTVDHVIPKARGGTNRLSNLCLACATCNSRKGHQSASEYRATGRLALRRLSVEEEAARVDL